MKKVFLFITILLFCTSLIQAQDPSTLFFNGGVQDPMAVWAWSFIDNDVVQTPIPNIGYSPGTSALKWGIYNNDGWQGVMFYLADYSSGGIDMTSIWDTDSVYFKLRAPNGLDPSDPDLSVTVYDPTNDMYDWNTMAWYTLDNFHDLDDGNWHQFAVALADLQIATGWSNTPIDKANIVGVGFEYFDTGINTEINIDEVWIGNPDILNTMTFFNGQALGSEVWFEAWGFENNNLTLAEGEGFVEGTPAILWETANWTWQGIGFIMNTHDMTYSFTADTMRLKIKAPAGIEDLALEWYDVYYNDYYLLARKVLDDVVWDGTWQEIEVPLSDFSVDDGFDLTQVYEFGIVAAGDSIPERILIDDIWLGDPGIVIDIVPPPVPENIIADVSTNYYNFISWDPIESETGETFDVYGSLEPIDNLESENVFVVATDVAEGQVAVHNLDYPLADNDVTYYYAVTCTDAASNPSEGFGTGGPFTNVGKKRAIISLEESFEFVADGDPGEWEHIMPFTVTPDMKTESNWYEGSTETFDDSLDYTAFCYVAMDDTTLYVAFDVIDDAFSWDPGNTSDWWNDESIEFYFGLYDMGAPHSWYERGEEPDYRLVFTPNSLNYFNGDESTLYAEGTANYYFQPLGSQDYFIEARIPFKDIRADGDAVFTPMEGYTIPFEIFCADADVTNANDVSRVQYGNNTALDPWGYGPDVWTFAWIGMPNFTAIETDETSVIKSYNLADNYPNPFNPSTNIEYTLAKAGKVSLSVYDVLGQKVAVLVDNHQPAGRHIVTFNATELTSGVYFYEITSENFSDVKKMLLVR